MKRTLLALGVLGAFSNVVHAQSSVTLYGLFDEGVDYTSNIGGHGRVAMSSGDIQGSRWGMKGTEDLGGGLKTIFQIESGFNVNTGKLGQGGAEFGRQAYVGLSSAKAGTLTLGRQYDSFVDYVGPLTANGTWGGGMFSHPYDNDNTDNSFRLNNAIKYTSLDYNGFSFGGAYAFSNSTQFAANRAESVGAQYTNGPLTAAVAYLDIDQPGGSTTGAVGADANWIAARQRVFGGGLIYKIGPAALGFVYSNTNLSQPTGSEYLPGGALAASSTLGAASSLKFNNFEFNAKYQITPAFFVGGMYTYTQATYDGTSGGSAKSKYHQFGLIADYNLSKRTDVYVQAAYIKVVDGSGVAGTGLEFASNVDSGVSSGNNQTMARIAIRHKF